MRYSTECRDRVFVNYGFLSFAKKMGNHISTN